MSLDSTYVSRSVDRNERVIRSYHTVRSNLLSSYWALVSLLLGTNNIGTRSNCMVILMPNRLSNGGDSLADMRSDRQQGSNSIHQ